MIAYSKKIKTVLIRVIQNGIFFNKYIVLTPFNHSVIFHIKL